MSDYSLSHGDPSTNPGKETLLALSFAHSQAHNTALTSADAPNRLYSLAQPDYRVTDIHGIDVVTAAELIALVGYVTRFPTVDKFPGCRLGSGIANG